MSASRPSPAESKLLIAVWHEFTLWRTPPELAERVRRRYPEMKVVHLPDYEHMEAEVPDTSIFVGYSLRPEQFTMAKKLKWIHSTAAGVAQLMYPELRESSVVVTNARGIHTTAMAEHLLGALVALARQFPACVRYQEQLRWAQQEIWDRLRPRELAGQVLLIVGLGAIGRELARCAKPLGMKIWAITRTGAGDASLADRILPASQLSDVLGEADFVVLTAPETPETHHLIGARQLAAMKPTSYLINVARGTLVDEPALIDALRKGVIAGAALDVTTEEPLPKESPLWTLENVFLSPHISAATDQLWSRQGDLLLENLERWFGGRELINPVDLKRGY